MAIVQIDGADAKPLEAFLTGNFHIFRIGAYRHVSRFTVALNTKLRREENIVSFARALEPLAHNVLAVSIQIGCVPKALANSMCVIQERDFFIEGTRSSIDAADAHETESNCGYLRAVMAKFSIWDRHLDKQGV